MDYIWRQELFISKVLPICLKLECILYVRTAATSEIYKVLIEVHFASKDQLL
jgi:hypothetical protein